MMHAHEALIQVREGRDFPPPRQILNRVKPDDACRLVPFVSRSLAELVWHTDFWQQIWLARLEGSRARSITEDWYRPGPEEWEATRDRFLLNLDRAVEIAETGQHRMKSDEIAERVLLQIAVHNTYHVGQWVLVKRALRNDRD
ncbi:MAG: DinB family protein [Methanoregulaceae archaeon]|nr:DinB family protein [Methanoregulaceae archaeon]